MMDASKKKSKLMRGQKWVAQIGKLFGKLFKWQKEVMIIDIKHSTPSANKGIFVGYSS